MGSLFLYSQLVSPKNLKCLDGVPDTDKTFGANKAMFSPMLDYIKKQVLGLLLRTPKI